MIDIIFLNPFPTEIHLFLVKVLCLVPSSTINSFMRMFLLLTMYLTNCMASECFSVSPHSSSYSSSFCHFNANPSTTFQQSNCTNGVTLPLVRFLTSSEKVIESFRGTEAHALNYSSLYYSISVITPLFLVATSYIMFIYCSGKRISALQ